MTHSPVQPPQTAPYPTVVKPPSNGVSTASLVVGIIGALIAFIPVVGLFGAFLGVVAVGLAVAGIVLAGKRGVGKGKSIAGLILGIAAVLICIVMTTLTVAAVDSAVKEVDKEIAAREDTSTSTDVSAKDEIADATLGQVVKGEFDTITVKVTVKNSSENTSDYIATVVFESPDGSKQYGTGALFVTELDPGQTKAEDVMMLDELPADAGEIRARLTDFDRIQSF